MATTSITLYIASSTGGTPVTFTVELPDPPPTEPVEGESSLGNSCDVVSVQHVGLLDDDTLGAHTVWNQFDEHGLLAGIPRNNREANWSYKRRLLETFIHQANCSYRGMVNGITRELGLALFRPITILPKRSSYDQSFLAPDPYIKFDGAYLYLYSDYARGVIEHKIDRLEPGGNYEHMQRLVDFINTSTYFEAALTSSDYTYTRSMAIINQSNRCEAAEPAQSSTRFTLQHRYVVPGSLMFQNDYGVFVEQVPYREMVQRSGQFYIDYVNSCLYTYSMPIESTTIRYSYTEYPFRPWASPVVLCDINNTNFRVKMFEQVLQDDGSFIDGLPTELGVNIINELMTVTPMYWGI